MNLVRIASLAILLLAVSATRSEKKIELQDIEEDNLKSEQEVVPDNTNNPQQNLLESEKNLVSLELLKRGPFRATFQNPTPPPPPPPPQQTRYVHQYAVSEPSEKLSTIYPHVQTAAASQQATIGYLSNVPMHIYLIPQGYGEQTEETVNNPIASVAQGSYNEPALTSLTANYVGVPTYLVPAGNGYMHQYTPKVTYVTYDSRLAGDVPANPHLTVLTGPAASTGLSNPLAPLISYNVPTPPYPYNVIHKDYYAAQRVEPDEMEDPSENKLEEPENYHEQTEAPEVESLRSQYLQYEKQRAQTQLNNNHQSGAIETLRDNYPSGTLEKIRDKKPSGAMEYNHLTGAINELPTPNPLLLKGSTSSIPKALPYYRPTSKPVYGTMRYTPDPNAHKLRGAYTFFKKYPNSLLDSYIPSKVQVEYMKKSYNKDPLSAYEALSSARMLYSHPLGPRTYERGFLPNQMYHTAAGGVTFGQFKKTPKTVPLATN